MYLNIWTVKSLEGYAAAYSGYPASADAFPTLDGVVSEHRYFGYDGTASEISRHVLTHEVGHYLNLYHPWDLAINGGPCGDDQVADTPITKFSSCVLYLAECTPGVIENVQNYMTASYCERMFTVGQKERMIDALNSSVGMRNNLWKHENLIATGLISETNSIEMVENQMFDISPNPAIDKLLVQMNSLQNEILVIDLYGKVLLKRAINFQSEITIDLSSFVNGTYFLKLGNETQKFVIQR